MKCCTLSVSAAVLLSVSASFAAGCGGSSTSPPTTPSVTPNSGQAAVTARIGWTELAPSLAEANAYSYKIYVDGPTRLSLASVSCRQGSTNTSFDCSADLPPLTQGQHVLELAAVDATGVEGPRAQPLPVVVSATGVSVRAD